MAAAGEKNLKLGVVARSQYAALKDGNVKPRGYTLDVVEVAPMPPHATVAYNVNAGVQSPKDLEGKKIGVRAYAGTAGVWARGLLQSEYGVDPSKVTWVLNDNEHLDESPNPSNATLTKGANLGEMLTGGELAAAIGLQGVDSPDVKPLIGNARQAQSDWFKKTGVFPINNTVVVKDELLAADPGLAESLFAAFKEAKAAYLKRLKEQGAQGRDEEADLRFMEVVGDDPLRRSCSRPASAP
jgi:4,5-dihydroxyphthalate decarboxylase